MYFLSEQTITNSFNKLTTNPYKYDGELFTLLVLKSAGLSKHEYLDLSDESIKRKLLNGTKTLAYLYISEKYFKEKYTFVNPIAMRGWGKNPTESIQVWSTQRLINNVTGGGKQWKSIVVSEPNNPNSIKLKSNYLDFFKDATTKISLEAISIWIRRFDSFSKEISLSNLISTFLKKFSVTDEEKIMFFSTQTNIEVSFDEEPVKSIFIRKLIIDQGNDQTLIEKFKIENSEEVSERLSDSTYDVDLDAVTTTIMPISYYRDLVDRAAQVIFMGPPGTSKSYLAKEISNDYDYIKRIQFHPQYSYQDFIGGKILENGTLKDKKGEIIELLEDALLDSNVKKKYLLIIEEINRANVSQVFGEMIQLLDRGESLELTFNGEKKLYSLPNNLKIIGTMNTTDRTVGRIDYAIKRRFYQVYCRPELNILIDKVRMERNELSISDLLMNINLKLQNTLNNKEMVIGHAIFLKEFTYNNREQKFIWNLKDFEQLFNFVILPLIEDYCNGNLDLVVSILGEKLYSQLTGEEFVQAIKEYLS